MKIKIDEQPNRICKYYLDILEDFYLKKLGGVLLDWWFFTESDYYLIHHQGYDYETRITSEYFDEYHGCTPFILIDRRNNRFKFDDESQEDFENNKWVIYTIGCDDGNKGWIFKDKHSALSWYAWIKKEIFKNKIHEEYEWKDYDAFLDKFSKNQKWRN